jgi:hypothetical protein
VLRTSSAAFDVLHPEHGEIVLTSDEPSLECSVCDAPGVQRDLGAERGGQDFPLLASAKVRVSRTSIIICACIQNLNVSLPVETAKIEIESLKQ